MKYVFKILILIQLGWSLACTKATPKFDLLDQNAIPQPKFSGSTVKNISTSSANLTFSVTGECDPKIREITAMAVNASATFSSLSTVATGSPVVTCAANGTFSFTLKSLTNLGFSPVQGNTYEVQLKAVTSAGVSRASSIYISYATGVGNPNIRISAGTPLAAGVNAVGGDSAFIATDGTTFQAEIHVNHSSKIDPGTGNIPTDSTNFTFYPAGFAR